MASIERVALTKREAAESLGISERSLDRIIESGRLPVQRVDRRIMISVESLRRFANGEEASA